MNSELYIPTVAAGTLLLTMLLFCCCNVTVRWFALCTHQPQDLQRTEDLPPMYDSLHTHVTCEDSDGLPPYVP